MAQKTTSQTDSDLLGGWMPRGWWGDEAEPTPKRRRAKAASSCGLKTRDPRVKTFRSRYYQLVAISAADAKAQRVGQFPFGVEQTEKMDGEGYFLTMCQCLYREKACKEVLGEQMAGEDLIHRLIRWWAQGPLEPGHLRNAMVGTSLELEDDD